MKCKLSIFVLLTISLFSCKKDTPKVELASWEEGSIKTSILNFIHRDTLDIPVEDRIAVFDMDGTIACETPLWDEMYSAVAKLNEKLEKDSALLKDPTYMFAKLLYINPADTFVHNNWVNKNGNFIDSMVWKAFEGEEHEYYVSYSTAYLKTTINSDKKMLLADMFYKPMQELIDCLTAHYYQVYVVSGSMQGVVWSIVPEKTGINRSRIIGTRQIVQPKYSTGLTQFTIQKGIFPPKNVNAGKSDNIYARIGKTPVFAFGNTLDDYDMLNYAITSKHKGVGFLLNHDDSREYIYPPYHGAPDLEWESKLKSFGGQVVSMKSDFKIVW